MKPYRVEYVQLAGWEEDVVGLWLAENEDWLLLRHIPVDYVVDGYVLLVKNHIKSRTPRRDQRQVELVLKLKGVSAALPPHFHFGADVIEMMRWVEGQYGLVEFADEEETTFFGRIGEVDVTHFWPTFTVSPKGNQDERDPDDKPFVRSEIQVLTFDTDYFNSIKLLWQHKQRRKLPKPSDN